MVFGFVRPIGRAQIVAMARYEHLPIYKQSLDVAVHSERVVAGFSRYHKYTLGTELRDCRAQKSIKIKG